MIVFLTDGEPTVGETSSYAIKENIKQANSDLNIPIYGLAFGDGADFNLVKDISDESNGFAQRIYESGNSFEQLEDFYTKISGTLKVCMPTIKIPLLTNFLPDLYNPFKIPSKSLRTLSTFNFQILN